MVAIDDIKEALAEREINIDWFTDKFAMLDDLGELGFNTKVLYEELKETFFAIYPKP